MKRMRKALSVMLAAVLMLSLCIPAFAEDDTVKMSDYLAPDTGVDAADIIQQVIDENPNRTIVFPDGEYLVSKPVLTPADPEKSVSLRMTDFTVIKAVGDWESGQAVIQLGGKDPANTTHSSGSNYSLESGVIDANGIADGISVNSGRETSVRNTSVKNAVTGLHIMYGANNGSSDADISGVNIIGTGKTDSIGVLIEGYDNTLTNMRIGYVFYGVVLRSGGNMLRNIHPLYYSDGTDYENSCGFVIESGSNFFDYCYSDEFSTGFHLVTDSSCIFDDCFCYWYEDQGSETAVKCDGSFNSVITDFTATFQGGSFNTVLETGSITGSGTLSGLNLSGTRSGDIAYKGYKNAENIFEQIYFFLCRLLSVFCR